MLLTGQPITAHEALQYGLVNKVVTNESLSQETMGLAEHITRFSGDILKLGKQAFYSQMSKDIFSAYELAGNTMVKNLAHPDAEEGLAAFLEKREPQWKS